MEVTITSAEDGDGCCPPNTTILDDDDCKPKCGDGVITQGETCDGHCPTSCDDGNECTRDDMSGSPATCNVRCDIVELPITGRTFDGCCPPSADATQDVDCDGVCGNAIVELKEQCDPDAPGEELGVTCDDRCFRISP